MNLKHLTDQALNDSTKTHAHNEREQMRIVLHHLREVERRRLFSDLKYRSLFEYAVKELKYSHDQAGRRISAMRLLKELPQVEEQMTSGTLTLTNLSMAANFFAQEQKLNNTLTSEQKL